MKLIVFLMGFVFIAGCGSASSNVSPVEEDTKEAAPTEPTTPEAPIPNTEREDVESTNVVGIWENSSCGERKYRRVINFLKDGKLEAVDEVAPCPSDRQCVWSGIIHWYGTWTIENRTVSLDIQPAKDGKMPEILPDEFVILNQDPVSIGGREGSNVCPYQKSK